MKITYILNEELSQEDLENIEPSDYWSPEYSKEDLDDFGDYSREDAIDNFENENQISFDQLDTVNNTNLLDVLREELEKEESERGFLRFRFRGDIYDGIPISEVDPSKFIFKIDDKLASVKLSEIKVL